MLASMLSYIHSGLNELHILQTRSDQLRTRRLEQSSRQMKCVVPPASVQPRRATVSARCNLLVDRDYRPLRSRFIDGVNLL